MSEWIEWKGGDQPVHDDEIVEVKCRDGCREMDKAKNLPWWWDGGPCDFLAYRIVKEPSC